jgi:tetratricopeptide (TPR) repeat protein
MSEAEIAERLEFVRSDGNVDVYRDKTTGQECFVGRTAAVSEEDAARAQELYEQAVGLIRDLIVPDVHSAAPLDVTDKYACEHAIPLLTEVVQLFPLNWQSMWLLGKIYQRMGDNGKGLEWFSRAHRVAPAEPDAAREAAISCMELGQPQEAIGYCQRAIEANPRDAGLRANLALALLFSERPEDARKSIHESLSMNPRDEVSARIGEIVDEVLAGTRPCPKHIRDLE